MTYKPLKWKMTNTFDESDIMHIWKMTFGVRYRRTNSDTEVRTSEKQVKNEQQAEGDFTIES